MKAQIINFSDLTPKSQKEYREWETNGFFEGKPAPEIIIEKGKCIFDTEIDENGKVLFNHSHPAQ